MVELWPAQLYCYRDEIMLKLYQLNLPYSQLIPEYPSKHSQTYPLLKLLHLPCPPHESVEQKLEGGPK